MRGKAGGALVDGKLATEEDAKIMRLNAGVYVRLIAEKQQTNKNKTQAQFSKGIISEVTIVLFGNVPIIFECFVSIYNSNFYRAIIQIYFSYIIPLLIVTN